MLTQELKETIDLCRERYTRPPNPTCRLCGGPMEVGYMGQGRVEYYCAGEAANWLGMEPGPEKRKREDHYNASMQTQTRFGDCDVLALCDALDPPAR